MSVFDSSNAPVANYAFRMIVSSVMPVSMCIGCLKFVASACSMAILLVLLTIHVAAQVQDTETQKVDWHQFRGPLQNGTAPGQNPPLKWSEDTNVLWKSPVHDRGWASPVVLGNEVWLTSATEDGKQMFALCYALDTGAKLHDVKVFENEAVQPDYHVTNSYASPTPVMDNKYLFVHYGAYGTACLDRKTAGIVWRRRDLPCNHFRGAGSSPILFENMMIVHLDGYDYQYVVALDRETGKTIWKRDRDVEYGTDNGDVHKSYCTPIVIQVDGQPQLISPTSKAVLAYDPRTGQEIWRARYSEHSTTARPLFDGTHLFVNTGFGKAQLLCLRVGGTGDLTETNILWAQRKAIGSKPSQILVSGRLFSVTDDGLLSRIDTRTGEIVWQERLGGNYSASLVATDTHVYAFDHEGHGYVYTIADQPQRVAMNQLDDGCRASPAIIANSLLVRTSTHLYRLQSKP